MNQVSWYWCCCVVFPTLNCICLCINNGLRQKHWVYDFPNKAIKQLLLELWNALHEENQYHKRILTTLRLPCWREAQLAKLAIWCGKRPSQPPGTLTILAQRPHTWKSLIGHDSLQRLRTLTSRPIKMSQISSYLSHSAEAQDTEAGKTWHIILCKLLTHSITCFMQLCPDMIHYITKDKGRGD